MLSHRSVTSLAPIWEVPSAKMFSKGTHYMKLSKVDIYCDAWFWCVWGLCGCRINNLHLLTTFLIFPCRLLCKLGQKDWQNHTVQVTCFFFWLVWSTWGVPYGGYVIMKTETELLAHKQRFLYCLWWVSTTCILLRIWAFGFGIKLLLWVVSVDVFRPLWGCCTACQETLWIRLFVYSTRRQSVHCLWGRITAYQHTNMGTLCCLFRGPFSFDDHWYAHACSW